LNTSATRKWVEENEVIPIKADKTRDAPDVDALLIELGNLGRTLPYVAIYPADGSRPIILDGPITQGSVLDALKQAGPSKKSDPATTAKKK
jgi:thiol:disulfide interchange protein